MQPYFTGPLRAAVMLRLIAAALASIAIAVPAQAKSQKECRAEARKQFPPGSLSARHHARQAWIEACMKGANIVPRPRGR
jgi:hypothetical protein